MYTFYVFTKMVKMQQTYFLYWNYYSKSQKKRLN